MGGLFSITTIWVVLIVVFIVLEAMTLGLTSIWFAFGALFALVASLIFDSLLIQITVFLISSIVLLYFTKPIAKKYLKAGQEKTNVDSLIGAKGVVTKEIEKHIYGLVKVNGQIWTAYSDEDLYIDDEITVEEIKGVKMKVKKEDELC